MRKYKRRLRKEKSDTEEVAAEESEESADEISSLNEKCCYVCVDILFSLCPDQARWRACESCSNWACLKCLKKSKTPIRGEFECINCKKLINTNVNGSFKAIF